MTEHRHPASPILDHCPPSLPRAAYVDPEWYTREMAAIWRTSWVNVGRLSDFAPGSMRSIGVGGAPVLLCRLADGALRAFHNTCRHRGSELCGEAVKPLGKLIACPYHAWTYAADDGRLVSTAFATPTGDFRKDDHRLHPVAVTEWNGFVFANLADDPGPLAPDMGIAALDNWPMASLITGHRITRELACNWKAFWENYNECLHCPGIHPTLCDMVPIYRQGIMAQNEAPGWTPGAPREAPLKAGAATWTPSGQPCGPEFPGLTAEERQRGFTFVTLLPTMYLVAHVDHVRAVTLTPTGPETTRLTAEWLFPPETLVQPGFDAAHVASFATTVMDEDGAAAEMNQRGLRSPAFRRGTLMPQEYDIARFHAWVTARLEGGAP
jgi:Rieske 2Fe-2S family protein